MKKQKEFKEKELKEKIDWETYKMKKDYSFFWAILLIIIYSFVAYSFFRDFNGFSSLFAIIKFLVGVIAVIIIFYSIKRIFGGSSKWIMLV